MHSFGATSSFKTLSPKIKFPRDAVATATVLCESISSDQEELSGWAIDC